MNTFTAQELTKAIRNSGFNVIQDEVEAVAKVAEVASAAASKRGVNIFRLYQSQEYRQLLLNEVVKSLASKLHDDGEGTSFKHLVSSHNWSGNGAQTGIEYAIETSERHIADYMEVIENATRDDGSEDTGDIIAAL